jgi:Carboxypeptidase regulatory-like domain
MGKWFGCTLALLAAVLISTEAATISGVVKEGDSTGTALSGAIVSVSLGGGGAQTISDTTDASGVYTFSGITVGQRRVRVSKSDYVSSGSVTVNVTDSLGTYTANLYMVSSANAFTTVSGTVTDSISKAALGGAKVILRAGQIRDTVITGVTGDFSFDSVEIGTVTLTSSLTGYVSKSTNLTITTTASPVAVTLSPVQYGSLLGTVTDSVAKIALSGATVILRQSGGMGGTGTSIDTTTTAADGRYLFDKVATGSYTVNVSFTGYVSKTSSTLQVSGTASDTGDITLEKIMMGSITGIVTSDSTRGPAIAGVTVILSLRSSMGGSSGTALDTVTTDAAGNYSFTNVASGSNYRVAASMSGYTGANSNINGKSSGTDTVNIAINKIGTGTLLVKVLKQTDSTVVAGASIAGVINGTSTLTGVSAANGTVSFADITIANNMLNVSVTAAATGFNAGTGTGTIPRNGADTVEIYLSAATASKMLKGTVIDSLTKKELANVIVVLSITGGGAGGAGTSLTFVDTTGSDGAYVFSMIPVNRTSGSLTMTLTGYRTVGNNNMVTLGTNNTADTTTRTITMIPVTPVIIASKTVSAVSGFRMMPSGIIEFYNITGNGIVKIFSVDGKLIFKSSINTNTRNVKLPENLTRSGKSLIVSLTIGKNVYRKEVVVQ